MVDLMVCAMVTRRGTLAKDVTVEQACRVESKRQRAAVPLAALRTMLREIC